MALGALTEDARGETLLLDDLLSGRTSIVRIGGKLEPIAASPEERPEGRLGDFRLETEPNFPSRL